ncbi:hypothetical protein D8824_05205 [Streptococcus intermedius]|nr:hypothetical protein [Streptococcus intermedius]RSJ09701.1 hypothetical protein D8833_07620 [Streptococcus intermedius]RSJ16126.1 hypothetical protein D8831_05205 [Streptococcus intermedius]RSJ30875.1 hypothetical protein D8824_05205 [Streptococcus intermedius]
MEDKVIELADWLINQSKTYSEAMIACEKLLKDVAHEIQLRALENKTRR